MLLDLYEFYLYNIFIYFFNLVFYNFIFFFIIFIFSTNLYLNISDENISDEKDLIIDIEDEDQNIDENDNDPSDENIKILNKIDDSQDPYLQNFKKSLMRVKKSFACYWDNYYHFYFRYNHKFKIFNWFRFNHWLWKSSNYTKLKIKSDMDFEELKLAWLDFQRDYLRIPKNKKYHKLATKIFLNHFDKLQLIKTNIKKFFYK